MKKLVVFFTVMLMGAVVMAQSDRGVRASNLERERTMKNLRDDVRAHEATKQVVGHDVTHFRIRQAIMDHKQVSETHRRVDADRRVARSQGIDHPISLARRQIREEDQRERERHG